MELVFSPRSKQFTTVHSDSITDKHTQDKTKPGPPFPAVASSKAKAAPPRRTRGLGQRTISKQSCPGSRACNPARSNTSQYTGARRPRRDACPTLLRSSQAPVQATRRFHTPPTLNYTQATLKVHVITHATDM